MTKDPYRAEVLIVGGGLSGLHTAYELQKQDVSFLLVEARDRFGGRILSSNLAVSKRDSSKHDNSAHNIELAAFDLGPSWFWPGQSRIHELINELSLTKDIFMQSSEGDALYEDNQSNVQRGISGVSMQGAYRMKGGIRQIIEAMITCIPSEFLLKNAAINEIKYQHGQVVSTVLIDGLVKEIVTKKVVLALPPRVALASIKFEPKFPQKRMDELNAVATWMAGHAKFVAVYKNRFWNEAGFSGDVISHRGPLQEIHDASSGNGELNALFGFVSIPAQYRKGRQEELQVMAIAQLVRLFGEAASQPIEIHMKDWAFDMHTSTSYDQEILKFHPTNDIVNAIENTWGGQLIWSGSESAENSNGFLEGALDASVRTLSNLTA